MPCPNCGDMPHDSLHVVTERKVVAWQGCEACWPLVIARGQLMVVQELCRAADAQDQGMPARVEQVLR